MDEFVGLVVQSVNGNLNSEFVHLALAALGALGGLATALFGAALGVVVRRSVTKFFAQQDEFEKRISAIESSMGLKGVTKNRPADGDSRAVL